MSNKNTRVALVVRLEAKAGHEAEVKKLLEEGVAFVNEESGTPYWFGVQLGERTFGIFDAFPEEGARKAHLAGKLAAALLAKADAVLEKPPVIESVDVIAQKDTWGSKASGARIRTGLLVRMDAKSEYAGAVAQLLADGRAYVEEESGTPLWFAVRMDHTRFAIFDAFVGDAERNAHLDGKLAKALLANAEVVLASPPVIETATVLASKTPS